VLPAPGAAGIDQAVVVAAIDDDSGGTDAGTEQFVMTAEAIDDDAGGTDGGTDGGTEGGLDGGTDGGLDGGTGLGTVGGFTGGRDSLGDGFGEGIGFDASLMPSATLRLNASLITGETEGIAPLTDTGLEGNGDTGVLGTTLADNAGLMTLGDAMLERNPGDNFATIDEGTLIATSGCPFTSLTALDGSSSHVVSLGGDFCASFNNFPGSCPKAFAQSSAILWPLKVRRMT